MLQLTIRQGVFLLSCCCLTLLAAPLATHPSEVNALLKVKHSLVDSLKHLRNWKKGDPCTSNWTAVLCFPSPRNDSYLHVRELHLLNMNLSGTLAPELGQLSQLEILNFMWNELTGGIPKEIGYLSSLKLLLLNGNKLSGSLPDELGNLSMLDRLQVDENYISGQVPKSFANLSRVKHIHLNNNSISGQIPKELSNLSTLIHLLLDNNNLSGSLPTELSNMPQLRILQLDNNNFDSEIPISYGNFSTLVKLSLRNCNLRGHIPDLSGILDLLYLDLSRNELSGPIPSKLSYNMTTINLSDNRLNGSIPASLSNFSSLQALLVANNLLTGSVPVNIWQGKSLNASAKLTIDLRNNSLTTLSGDLNPPENVTLRLGGNPLCNNANAGKFCASEGSEETVTHLPKSSCPVQACPTENFFEYVPGSPVPCFCASPIRIGYRLKSPSFSYFPPYKYPFESYVTAALKLDTFQLAIDSFKWEDGPRLRMYLKLFPSWSKEHSGKFNASEVGRISEVFSAWEFPRTDFFGPYELLNFTLLGPYSQMDLETRKTSISKGVWAAIILGAAAFTVAVSAIVTILIVRRHGKHRRGLSRKRTSSLASMKIEGVKFFTFREMASATDNFNTSTQVGRGGYGRVYKGTLADKSIVAIKRAEQSSLQGQKEFLTEIELLSRLHHRNLVSLVGYCDEEGEQMLVYEFMPNGTLRDWLSGSGKQSLNFAMRLSIVLGSAKGILYLHTEANPPVFHRDIKASNILLDSKLTAKVADFGLSRLAPVLDEEGNLPNHISTVVKGTPGYLDPEYFLTRKLTDKSDVYSLGIVFLELLTGMHPISHGKNIVREVNVAHQSGLMFSIIDDRMGLYPSDCVEKFIALALSCCHENPDKRPSMLDVVRELENINKMMPKTDTIFANSSTSPGGFTSSSNSSNVASTSLSSSSFYRSRDAEGSSTLLGSDLVSGINPTITPR